MWRRIDSAGMTTGCALRRLRLRGIGAVACCAFAAALGACGGSLYPSRVALAPYDAKLSASGSDPNAALHPHAAGDLDTLVPVHRYKFVVLGDGQLVIA